MRIVYLVAIVVILTGCGGAVSDKNSNIVARNQGNATNTTVAGPIKGQTVTIDSPDGVRLIGTFFEAAKPNSPALLLLHQWQSDRHSYDDFAKRMQENGFNVLSIDGRGFGESTKTADGKPVAPERTDAAVKGMLGDVGAAFEFLSKQANVDPTRIGIVGASYGSSLAIIYSADDPRVKAVGLLSPGLNYFGNMATEPAIAKYGDRPLLLVAADDDKESADAARKLKETARSDKYEVKIYGSGGHGTGLFEAKVGLEDLLSAFFAKNLRAR